jgi:hypothetical protein
MYSFIEFPRSGPALALPVGALVLGIEVTIAEQAALCSLGNVDGQHWSPATVEQLRVGCWATTEGAAVRGVRLYDWVGRAACDIATEIPLPPDGAYIATTRADLDSVAAMAVLVLRGLDLLTDAPEALQGAHDASPYVLGAPRAEEIAAAEGLWGRLRRIAERDSFRPSTDWAMTRPRGIMLELTVQRLRTLMTTPLLPIGEALPPPVPTAWERAIARRDRLVPPEVRTRLELDQIDRAW